jgi:hypothetical protein
VVFVSVVVVQSGALEVVAVFDAVIGVATPICRPLAGAIGTTREITGSLLFKLWKIKMRISFKQTVSYVKKMLVVELV